jgi:hypothetical protein
MQQLMLKNQSRKMETHKPPNGLIKVNPSARMFLLMFPKPPKFTEGHVQ